MMIAAREEAVARMRAAAGAPDADAVPGLRFAPAAVPERVPPPRSTTGIAVKLKPN